MGIQKAIAAFLGGLVTLLAQFLPGIENTLTPELVQSAGVVITALLVWWIPNREKDDA